MLTKLLSGELKYYSDRKEVSYYSLILVSLPSIALFICFYGINGIRWLDQVVINYLMNSSALGSDASLFGMGFVTSEYNPYFYLHRLIVYLSNLIDVPYTSITSISFLLVIFFSFFVLAKLTSLFTHSFVAILVTGILVALNVNLTVIGNSRLFMTSFAPFFIATPLALLAIYYFFSGKYSLLFVVTPLVVWIHFPSGFYICLILSLYFLFTKQVLAVAKRNWVALIFFLVSMTPYIYLLLIQLRSVDSPLPNWGVELLKILTYGHISLYYIFSAYPLKMIVFVFVAVLTYLSLTVFYKKKYVGTSHEDVAEKIQLLGFIVIFLLVLYFILVDIVAIPFLYKFELVKIFWYLSLFLVILIPATAQLVISELRVTGKISLRHLGSVLSVMLVLAYLYGSKPFAESDPNNTEIGWQNITKMTNKLPAESIVLAPYTRIDYYRFGKRLSPFNYYVTLFSFDHSLLPLFNEKFNHFIQDRFLESYVEEVVVDPSKIPTFKAKIRKSWEQLTIEKLQELQKFYGITHVIREAGLPLDLPVVFINTSFVVYRLI